MTILSKNVTSLGYDKQSEFTVELRPTSKCNYQCYYCTDLHINTNPVVKLSNDNLKVLIDTIHNSVGLPIHIFICGGEPSLYSELHSLVVYLLDITDTRDHITIQTNMSKNIDWFSKFLNLGNRFKFNGSYHNTQNIKLMEYIKKCVLLKQHGILGMVSFGYNKHKNVIKDYKFAKKILGEQHCEITPLINASVDQDPHKGNTSGDDIDYLFAQEDMTKFKQYGHFFQQTLPYTTADTNDSTSRAEMWLYRKNNFLSYTCEVSKYKLYVDWDGNCYKCFNEQFAPDPPAFHINNLDDMKKYFTNLKCMDCKFTTCFFDLEYKKTKQDKNIQEVKIDRKYNTHEYRSKSS